MDLARHPVESSKTLSRISRFWVVRWLARLVREEEAHLLLVVDQLASEGGFIPKRRRRPVAAWFNTQMAGGQAMEEVTGRASQRAIVSALPIAIHFGASSPSTMWRKVMRRNERVREIEGTSVTLPGRRSSPPASRRLRGRLTHPAQPQARQGHPSWVAER